MCIQTLSSCVVVHPNIVIIKHSFNSYLLDVYILPVLFLESVSNVFNHPDGRRYDFVINCAGETKYGQDSAVRYGSIILKFC